jgi:hypothetical protein
VAKQHNALVITSDPDDLRALDMTVRLEIV